MQNPGRKCRDLIECIRLATAGLDSVVELGCGFGDRLQLVKAPTRIGVDAHEPYIAEAWRRYPNITDFHVGDARDYVRQFDVVMNGFRIGAILMVDFLEHLTLEDAWVLLGYCKRIANRIILYVPLGSHPQSSDPYNMGGEKWQTHRSTWEVADLLAMGFDVEAWHTHPNKPVEPRAGFCIWNIDERLL